MVLKQARQKRGAGDNRINPEQGYGEVGFWVPFPTFPLPDWTR